jgi:predicted alpha/beta superfamily hydrolase
LGTFVALACIFLNASAAFGAQRYKVQDVASEFLGGNRTVRVYLPPSYDSESARRYPVLYVHDGQNVFSFAGTNVAFGWGSWELDKTADALSRAGNVNEIILVAVDNSPYRFAEYSGRHQPATATNRTAFENYEAFLIQELKPKIDASYRTQPQPATTGVMGSSMGGICSIVLAWDHPDIFGCAASLSGAFQAETNFLNLVLRPYHDKPKPLRLYFDSGTVDFMGGDDGRAMTEAVVAEFRRIGRREDLMLFLDAKPLTPTELEQTGLRRDKWAEAQTSQHNEFYWRQRVWRALRFLFPPSGK